MKARISLSSKLNSHDLREAARYINGEVDRRMETGLKVATQNALIQLVFALHRSFGFGAARIERLFAVMEEQKKALDPLSCDDVMIETILSELEKDGIDLRPMMIDAAESEEKNYFRVAQKQRSMRTTSHNPSKSRLNPEQVKSLTEEQKRLIGREKGSQKGCEK